MSDKTTPAKRTIQPKNMKGVYNTCNAMFAAIMNGEVDLERAKVGLEYLKEGNRIFENELKLAAMTGNQLRRVESTAFDNTTGEAEIHPVRKIG